MAQQILEYVRKDVDADKIWASFDSLPPTHNLWDDLINVAVQLRLIKQWDPIISVRLLYLMSICILMLLKSCNFLIAYEIFKVKMNLKP